MKFKMAATAGLSLTLDPMGRFLVISIIERKKGVDVGEEIHLIK
jgi:hypothetical protein